MTISSPDESPVERTAQVRSIVQDFYDRHPYPPPVNDLDDYRRRWQDERRRRADFHLFWPGVPSREDLCVLVAGCGTYQAARYALRQPAAQVTGIDISSTSVRHTLALKSKYQLENLEVHQLPIERVAELGNRFDKIVCTGVLHHLPDPQLGLEALRDVMAPRAAMHLQVYALYGRAGIYMLQDYCRRLDIGHSDAEILDLANTLTRLPPAHPLARLLAESPDFRGKDSLADALLNPQDRAYSVPQLLALVQNSGLSFVRWQQQAPYLPMCGSLAETPHAPRLAALPLQEQYAVAELYRGDMLRHNLILYRADDPAGGELPRFDGDGWLGYIPLRMPEAITLRKRLPPGAAAVLLNQAHSATDIFLPVDTRELRLVEAIDGVRSVDEIIRTLAPQGEVLQEALRAVSRSFFSKLYDFDQVVFNTAPSGGASWQ